jgi:hypothetical protein
MGYFWENLKKILSFPAMVLPFYVGVWAGTQAQFPGAPGFALMYDQSAC